MKPTRSIRNSIGGGSKKVTAVPSTAACGLQTLLCLGAKAFPGSSGRGYALTGVDTGIEVLAAAWRDLDRDVVDVLEQRAVVVLPAKVALGLCGAHGQGESEAKRQLLASLDSQHASDNVLL